MTSEDILLNNDQKNIVPVSMAPLYERLLKKPFTDTITAIDYCRNVCADFGFTVKQEASANRNIYVYCSREGLPDSQRNPKPAPQRKRPSKRCDCRWRVVLSENENGQWEFRKSMNPNASEHNHEMMSPDEMVKAWPMEVNDMIIYLAQQKLQTHEIREMVRQRFPSITWNERRFYNRLTEERKRIRQRSTVERTRRLLFLSSQLCAVVAGNEDWAQCVENDLHRMFENYCQLNKITPDILNRLVDLQPDAIQSDTEKITNTTHRLSIKNNIMNDLNNIHHLKNEHDENEHDHHNEFSNEENRHHEDLNDMNESLHQNEDEDDLDNNDMYQQQSPMKKRKSSIHSKQNIANHNHHHHNNKIKLPPKGSQTIFIPSFTIYARAQSFRSSSDASSQSSRRTCDSSSTTGLESPTHTVSSYMGNHHHHSNNNNNNNNNGLFSLASPTSSSSSSSSSMPFRQQPFRLDIQGHPHQPSHPHLTSPSQPSLTSPEDPSSHFMLPQTSQPQPQSYAMNDLSYNIQSFSHSYHPMSHSSFSSSPNDLHFTLDNQQQNTPTTTTTSTSSITTTSQQQHDDDHRSMFQYYPHIKEEERLFDRSSPTHPHFNNLPMIRTNDHSGNLPPMVTNATDVNPVTATAYY
ncbi:unnamed protein product [Cunninghamella blakesleeana]